MFAHPKRDLSIHLHRGGPSVHLCRSRPRSFWFRVVRPPGSYVSVDEQLRHVRDDARYRHQPLLSQVAEEADDDHRYRQRFLRSHEYHSLELSAFEPENVPAHGVVYAQVADWGWQRGRSEKGIRGIENLKICTKNFVGHMILKGKKTSNVYSSTAVVVYSVICTPF